LRQDVQERIVLFLAHNSFNLAGKINQARSVEKVDASDIGEAA
jgi:hypothetical protein